MYANHVVSDYRIPFYKELNRLFNGHFYVMYSPLQYKRWSEAYLEKVRRELDGIAYEYNGESVKTVKNPFSKDFDNIFRTIHPS